MVVMSIATSRGSLSPRQTLDFAQAYLELADPNIAPVLRHGTKVSFYRASNVVGNAKDQFVTKEIVTTNIGPGNLLERQGHDKEAKGSYKKTRKLGYA
jgi:hypothetical protein